MTEFSTAARVGQLRRALEKQSLFSDSDRVRMKAELADLEELLRYAR